MIYCLFIRRMRVPSAGHARYEIHPAERMKTRIEWNEALTFIPISAGLGCLSWSDAPADMVMPPKLLSTLF